MRILVVEEDRAVREAFKDTLEFFGYEVWDAPQGREALALVRGGVGPVDLVISDLITRHMNALELYTALRDLQADVKMLVVTSYPMPGAGQTLAAQPGVEWTTRPISMERLGQEVEMLLRDNGLN